MLGSELNGLSSQEENDVSNPSKMSCDPSTSGGNPAERNARRPLRVALIYDMDACKNPTGVTRHALGQIEEFSKRPETRLQLVSGKITQAAGATHWESLGAIPRRELPAKTRNMLRWWRLGPWPPVEHWAEPVDWVYCPSEYGFPTREALRAVTSHDIHQNLTLGPISYRQRLGKIFRNADLILSVSSFNTRQLLEAYPECEGRVAYVPNAADDEFFASPTEEERRHVRQDLGLPEGMPYFLSVANFQPRKNLIRLVRAAARLREVKNGEIGLVLLGTGDPAESSALKSAASEAGCEAAVRFPGYRQGTRLRAIYSEATALVFPSLCESFGIPAIEAMAQGIPVALADNTALPEIGGPAGWYFPPENEEAITAILRDLLDHGVERLRRIQAGLEIAARYRWRNSNDLLVSAMLDRQNAKVRDPAQGK